MFGFKKEVKINTDEKTIDDILNRSVSAIYPKKEDLKKELMSGRRLRIYSGADATGSQLHLGHAMSYLMLEKLRKLGHEIIILFGDFTATIGDPTDKSAARVRLTKKEVDENLKSWKNQISKIINFNDSNPPRIVRNGEWLSKMNFEDVVNLAANFTVQQMIERDMFQKRLSEQKPIYLHEFMYPLMQGYDSVVLDVDLEVGGNDQTFNMLAGRTLQEKINNKNKFVITLDLLANPKTGKKMSKSEGSYIALDDTPEDLFGKTMAMPDEMIKPLFVNCTFVSLDEINSLDIESKPKESKVSLAKEIVKMLYSAQDAESAAEKFERTFAKKDVQDFEEIKCVGNKKLAEILVENKIVESKSDFRRLIDQNAIENLETKEKIKDHDFVVDKNISLRVGKKRFVKIVLGSGTNS